ncbi:CPXCG motif-containing cysteine-rich protein [Gallaecimonas kandeliae]|uniref:CPXCG motif-containing cysteine-rich protein n=1 Tax=Gallaecimonas kandeliae TaxID=3029055 RepID=UPI0026488766|nr:CPXCG motif-containing cysteine-rich protein [Gallaecimonas kandeliae]WKE63959.1 CPXCG motif-containing cysteine-rich protein [Gallaecimonas kandeliae]
MDSVKSWRVECPNCGHPTFVTIEPGDVGQDFVEDCANCCSPIHILVTEDMDGVLTVQVDGEDEQLY